MKGAQNKPNPSPNAFPKLCEWFSGRFLLKGRGTRTVPSLRGKSSRNLPHREIERKEWMITQIITLRRNYFRKLSPKIMSENYQIVYHSRRKCEIYRDTGVSKNREYYNVYYSFTTPIRFINISLKSQFKFSSCFV